MFLRVDHKDVVTFSQWPSWCLRVNYTAFVYYCLTLSWDSFHLLNFEFQLHHGVASADYNLYVLILFRHLNLNNLFFLQLSSIANQTHLF